mmetsp:Transcript_59117/g.190138  ORF Transcript_59117/g.190138 Transcript_59117/m.190138 type:complete len:215 (-) Transcript_59117:2043-2687(-)
MWRLAGGDEAVPSPVREGGTLRLLKLGGVECVRVLAGPDLQEADHPPGCEARRHAVRGRTLGDAFLLQPRPARALRAEQLGRVEQVHQELLRRAQAAHACSQQTRGQRRRSLRRHPGGAGHLQRWSLRWGAEGLHSGPLGGLEQLRGRCPAIPPARGESALQRRRSLRGQLARDPDVQHDSRLRRLRVEHVGRVRQDLRWGSAAAAATGVAEPA